MAVSLTLHAPDFSRILPQHPCSKTYLICESLIAQRLRADSMAAWSTRWV